MWYWGRRRGRVEPSPNGLWRDRRERLIPRYLRLARDLSRSWANGGIRILRILRHRRNAGCRRLGLRWDKRRVWNAAWSRLRCTIWRVRWACLSLVRNPNMRALRHRTEGPCLRWHRTTGDSAIGRERKRRRRSKRSGRSGLRDRERGSGNEGLHTLLLLLLMGKVRGSTDVPRSRLKWGCGAAKLAGTRPVRILRERLLLLPVPSRLMSGATILKASVALLETSTILITTPEPEMTVLTVNTALSGRSQQIT